MRSGVQEDRPCLIGTKRSGLRVCVSGSALRSRLSASAPGARGGSVFLYVTDPSSDRAKRALQNRRRWAAVEHVDLGRRNLLQLVARGAVQRHGGAARIVGV